jgi:hypothetical protein
MAHSADDVGFESDGSEVAFSFPHNPQQPHSIGIVGSIPLPKAARIEAGSVCDVKDLFEGKRTCSCCIKWSTEPQKKLPTTATTDTGGYAILARKSEGHGDYGRERKLHSIVIQSPLIRGVLEGVMKGYPGITTGLENLTVEAPFECFYHRWAEMNHAHKTATGETAKHLDLLMDLLKAELDPVVKVVADLVKNNVIEYQYLWTIFKPGEHVYIKTYGQPGAMTLQYGQKFDETYDRDEKGYQLTCKHIDYNGSMTGYGTTNVKISVFKGTTSLTALPAVPLRFMPNKEQLEKELIVQGKAFAELRAGALREYHGQAVLAGDQPRHPNHRETLSDAQVCTPAKHWATFS